MLRGHLPCRGLLCLQSRAQHAPSAKLNEKPEIRLHDAELRAIMRQVTPFYVAVCGKYSLFGRLCKGGISYKRGFVGYSPCQSCYISGMETRPYIAYYRVSTSDQGRSGLGLEAQQQAVNVFLHGHRDLIVESFTEIESGRKNDRPHLAAALDACWNTRRNTEGEERNGGPDNLQ
jgi:hypothetical protein